MSGRRQVAIAFALMTLVFAGLLYRAEHRTDQTNERITKIASPCLLYGPHSKLCKESFEKAVATITHPEACAVERKAGTLRAIRKLAAQLGVSFTEPCAGARLAQERQRGNERAATSRADSAELAHEGPSPASIGGGSTRATGGSEPLKGGSTKPPAPGKGGSKGGEAPAKSPAVGTEAPPASSTPAPAAETSTEQTPPPPASSSTSEAPPGLIGNPGGVVGKAACDATEVVNELAGVRVCGK